MSTIRHVLPVLFVLIFLFPALTYADKAVIQVDNLNVRTGPGLNYERTGQVNKAETFDIIKEKDNWLQISINGKQGWVAKWLTKVNKSEAVQSNKYQSKVDYLRIRSSPSFDSQVYGHLMRDQVVQSTKQEGEWLKIDHKNGWVHADYVTATKDQAPSEPKEEEKKEPEPQKSIGKIKVRTNVLNVRSAGNTKGDIVSKIRNGDMAEYISNVNDWYQIKLQNGQKGWVAGWLVDEVNTVSMPDPPKEPPKKPAPENKQVVELKYNHTNLRKGPSTTNQVVGSGQQGETFPVIEKQGEWYKIQYKGGAAFVAGWIVKESTSTKPDQQGTINGSLKGKTILIDAGHGGRDSGAIGRSGSYEKTHTLQTAQSLKKALENKGAKVLMARDVDEYVSLSIRSYYSNSSSADVFLSLHYNSAPKHVSASGINTYYYHNRDKPLASVIQKNMINATGLKNRGVQYGNFHVIRENKKPALLLELGFLSDITEEQTIQKTGYKTKVSQGITNGLLEYFSK
ncbi:N-acetylmuramoyl-L-alanine amidase [Halobacillus litoralis]|uniref:N-acetylmuramoyl-L-alanine amidase n=1 Tax=Halobacillus litoralis TaxID=45668 RepID=UPI001CD2651E|nr:N-acetylmuramoyl-L-alanine amidase [Halobacillus litoralis]MCA0969973.1 N-acetylmuramoyl-L-alanine amidase [Halobacillus litoralis]